MRLLSQIADTLVVEMSEKDVTSLSAFFDAYADMAKRTSNDSKEQISEIAQLFRNGVVSQVKI